MEFKELIAGFAAKYGIEGLSGADGAVELEVDDVRVELLDNPQTHSIFACSVYTRLIDFRDTFNLLFYIPDCIVCQKERIISTVR